MGSGSPANLSQLMRMLNRVWGCIIVLSLALTVVGPLPVFAAVGVSPVLVGSSSYSVVAHTLISCPTASTISGTAGVSSAGAITCAVTPGTADVNTVTSAAALADETSAYGALDAQTCAPADSFGAIDLPTQFPTGVPAGVYCSSSTFSINSPLTLTGTGVWIFKTVSGLNVASGATITGGDPCNTWWEVGSSAVLGTGSTFEGNILALTSATINTGSTLNGRVMVQTGGVTVDGSAVSGPVCASVVPPSTPGINQNNTITLVKNVVNDNGGTASWTDFSLFVNGTQVNSGESVRFAPGTYTISETGPSGYTPTFSGDCSAAGVITHGGINTHNDLCIITNNDIGAPAVVPLVPPLIDVVKVPNPLALPNGPGAVTYTYTLRNIGTVPVTNITMVDNDCKPFLVSGDSNNDSILAMTETWTYRCTTILPATHTNTVVATGRANGFSTSDTAVATVVVGTPAVPPLIHVTKVPNPLTLLAGGGMVTYTEKITNPGTIALSNVQLTDDKCSPLVRISGDTNNDSLLDTTETWTYTCQTNLTATTTNTAVATGEGNGFSVRDFAVATVVVAAAVPALPNTGIAPNVNPLIPLGIVLAIVTIAGLYYGAARKKASR